MKARRCFNDFDTNLINAGKDRELEAEMQHYGIPTNYLDWSESPLTALYFALSVGDDFNDTPITDICLWVAVLKEGTIRTLKEWADKEWADKKSAEDNDVWKKDDNECSRTYFLAPETNNPRIINQKGYFSYTKGADQSKCLSEHNLPENQIKLHKIILKNDFLGSEMSTITEN